MTITNIDCILIVLSVFAGVICVTLIHIYMVLLEIRDKVKTEVHNISNYR